MSQTYQISQGSGPSRVFATVVSVLVLAGAMLALNFGLQLKFNSGPDIALIPPIADPPQKPPTDDPVDIDPTKDPSTIFVPIVDVPVWEPTTTDPPTGTTGSPLDASARIIGTPALPVYPPSSLENCEQGTVRLALSIGASGRVETVSVLSSSGSPALDNAAIKAAQRWRYKPAISNGEPVASTVTQPVTFDLRNEVGGSLTAAQLRECLRAQ